jgi:hypothetical protein
MLGAALVGVSASLIVFGAVFWLRPLWRTIRDAWVRYRAITNTPTTPYAACGPAFVRSAGE